MRHPSPEPSSRPACPLSLCQYQQKSRALCVQRRVFRRGGGHEQKGSVANRTPTWLKLVGRSVYSRGKSGSLQSPRGHRVQRQNSPRLSPSIWDLPPRVCTAGCRASRGPCAQAGRQELLGPSPRWEHLRLLGRTEAAEGGGSGYLLDASIDVQVDGLGPVA